MTPECSPIVPHPLRGDVPDPAAEKGPVKGKSTEGSDDEDREQRPYRCGHQLLLSATVRAFDRSPQRACCETGHFFALLCDPWARCHRAKNRLGQRSVDHDPTDTQI